VKVALCQINTTPGDISGNRNLILAAARQAEANGADLAIFPELAIVGYSPRDLMFRERFQEAAHEALIAVAKGVPGIDLLVGSIRRNSGVGKPFFNSAFHLKGGQIQGIADKSLLPDYDVFDEARYFQPAGPLSPMTICGHSVGVTICEDLWSEALEAGMRRYSRDPARELHRAGASILVNLSASPYNVSKIARRAKLVQATAERLRCPVLLCNLWGGNDEILFDGSSVAFDGGGACLQRAESFADAIAVVDLPGEDRCVPTSAADAPEELRAALVMGIRDYARKTGFRQIVMGLSGGIDSAVCACLAVEALGKENVEGLALPSPFSSEGSVTDARHLAERLGIAFHIQPIEQIFVAATDAATSVVGPGAFGVMEENLQARIRGLLLMAVSNRKGSLLLTTGNKSELAVGYCTLYGDMCGGLAAISDVYKQDVYALGRIYATRGWIPQASMDKPPSAELRPGQKDEDSLPPYPLLDAILRCHVDEDMGLSGILAAVPAATAEVVSRVMGLVARSEYKRRQAAPGLRVSTRAFGYGRRVPVVANALSALENSSNP
jgi:NAD+ synthetase